MITAQPSEQLQDLLKIQFEMLTQQVDPNLTRDNRDKFTRNCAVFKGNVKNHLDVLSILRLKL